MDAKLLSYNKQKFKNQINYSEVGWGCTPRLYTVHKVLDFIPTTEKNEKQNYKFTCLD